MEIVKVLPVILVVVFVFALVYLLAYAPVFLNRYRIKVDKRILDSEVEELSSLYEKSRLVIVQPLGGDGSQNSGILFAVAQKNQGIAVNSVKSLISDMKITRD